jgi:SulP family sulfate permease
MGVSLAISFAAVMFSDELESELWRGTGWALAGLVVIGAITAITSSFPGLAAGPQDGPAVILGAAAAGLVATSDNPVASLAAFTIVTSAVTGLFLLGMGRFRLGNLVRYVPFPVVAGFLGGTGVVLAIGGIELLQRGGGTSELGLLVIPGVLLGLVLAWLARREISPAVSVGVIVVAFVGFHLVAAVTGLDRAEGISRGLLLGPFPEGRLADLRVITELWSADWGAILGQLPAIVAMAIIAPLAMLLNTGALENIFKTDIDVDRELMATGAGVAAAAPFAAMPGFVFLGVTVLGRRIGGASRIPPLVAAGLAAIVLALGADVISTVPVFIPAGLLLALGFELIVAWVWDVRHRVGLLEHALIIAIVVTVAVAGFLSGVALGVFAATILFVVRYSRTPSVRSLSTVTDRRSNVQRSAADESRLTEVGGRIVLIELQGFLFFGKTEQIVRSVHEMPELRSSVEVLVVDFHRVTGIDSSAGASFDRLIRFTEEYGIEVVFCGATPDVLTVIQQMTGDGSIRYEVDQDRALEQCEERLLASIRSDEAAERDGPDRAEWADVPSLNLPEGTVIVTAGELDPGIYYLESGRAIVASDTAETGEHRHAVLLPGSVIGELSHLTGQPAMATVMCDTACVVRHVPKQWLDDLAVNDPARALELHRMIARRLAEKLAAANRTIRSLE